MKRNRNGWTKLEPAKRKRATEGERERGSEKKHTTAECVYVYFNGVSKAKTITGLFLWSAIIFSTLFSNYAERESERKPMTEWERVDERNVRSSNEHIYLFQQNLRMSHIRIAEVFNAQHTHTHLC